jgi:hypothetical protein
MAAIVPRVLLQGKKIIDNEAPRLFLDDPAAMTICFVMVILLLLSHG